MTVHDIEYVELYAGDGPSAVRYFESAFGFTKIAEAAGSDFRSWLLKQGSVQLIVTEGRVTEEFLEAHGDGVADVAFWCDDVTESANRAVAADASMISSPWGGLAIHGFGDVRHTLVATGARTGLPPGREWVRVAATATGSVGHIRLLDHVAVVVEGGTLADCADFYTRAFGLGRYSGERIEIGDQAMDSIVVRSASGGATFTILEQDLAKGKVGQVEAFISRNAGPGVQHLAFGVDDIIPSVIEFRGNGVEFLETPGTYYDMLADRLPGIRGEISSLRETNVLADRDEWGYLLQLFTRSPYERNTMFYELVQRRGARGFGSNNIKALYEAVERMEQVAG